MGGREGMRCGEREREVGVIGLVVVGGGGGNGSGGGGGGGELKDMGERFVVQVGRSRWGWRAKNS